MKNEEILLYHISLISRICFTNYRDFKSSLLPLLYVFMFEGNIWLELCYTTRHGKKAAKPVTFKLIKKLIFLLMWQIHGNLTFNLHRKGWFMKNFFFMHFDCFVGGFQLPAFDRNRQLKQIFETLIFSTHVKSVEDKKEKNIFGKRQRQFLGHSSNLPIPRKYFKRLLLKLKESNKRDLLWFCNLIRTEIN